MSTVDPHAGHAHTDDEMPTHHDAPATGPTTIDPVCGMTVTLIVVDNVDQQHGAFELAG